MATAGGGKMKINLDPLRLWHCQVATLFGMTSAAVVSWRRRGCPRNADGTYNATEILRWRLKDLQRPAVRREINRRDGLSKVIGPRGRILDPARLSGAQLTGIFGLTTAAMARWNRRGCPRNCDLTYDLAAVAHWILAGAYNAAKLPQKQIVRLLGVSRQAIVNWQREGCPRNADGTYDAGEVVRWRIRQLYKAIDRARADNRRRPKTPAWDPEHLRMRQLAAILDVTGSAVSYWAKRGCPRNSDRTFDLKRVLNWRLQDLARRRRRSSDETGRRQANDDE